MAALVCWRCGASLKDLSFPMVRLAQCKSCGADLHVCRLCKYYNPKLSENCDHDLAEPARTIDVANFCHYFKARQDAYNPTEKSRADEAFDQLKSLFGDATDVEPTDNKDSAVNDELDSAKARFDALFKKD